MWYIRFQVIQWDEKIYVADEGGIIDGYGRKGCVDFLWMMIGSAIR